MYLRLAQPGEKCGPCGTVLGTSIVCPGCGWVDPPPAPREPAPLFSATIHPDDMRSGSSHVRVTVRAGTTPGSLALLGQLTCRRGAEADELLRRLSR